MKGKIKKLTKKEIELFKKKFECLVFSDELDVVYETQVPPAGFLVIEGEVSITKKKKTKESILPGNLIGIYQLIYNQPVKFGMKVRANSKILILHKSEILEVLTNKAHYLYSILLSALK